MKQIGIPQVPRMVADVANRDDIVKRESAVKPGSVLGSHSSGMHVTVHL